MLSVRIYPLYIEFYVTPVRPVWTWGKWVFILHYVKLISNLNFVSGSHKKIVVAKSKSNHPAVEVNVSTVQYCAVYL